MRCRRQLRRIRSAIRSIVAPNRQRAFPILWPRATYARSWRSRSMARSRFRQEFPGRSSSNRNNRETSDDSNAPFPERSAGRCRREFSQRLHLLPVAGPAATSGLRQACHSARLANWRCFPESQLSNPQADEVVSEKFPVACRRTIVGLALEGKTETKMKRAEIFAPLAIGIPSVIESNRADRQLVTQTATKSVAHVVYTRFLGSWEKIAGVEE